MLLFLKITPHFLPTPYIQFHTHNKQNLTAISRIIRSASIYKVALALRTCACINSFNFCDSPMGYILLFSHFTDEGIEAQRD